MLFYDSNNTMSAWSVYGIIGFWVPVIVNVKLLLIKGLVIKLTDKI